MDAAESHFLRYMQCCGSGFSRIRIILPHLDPDRYQFQANDKVDKKILFSRFFNMLSKLLNIMTDEKNKYCKLAML
jgi:hypothetical protein